MVKGTCAYIVIRRSWKKTVKGYTSMLKVKIKLTVEDSEGAGVTEEKEFYGHLYMVLSYKVCRWVAFRMRALSGHAVDEESE